ncbi:MAG: aminotransferase class V-fold PLP-dependent enzyme [Acidobacteria bacterium]|nr:aminotransferase class V-fold PLP-dependent enzyme [Acidobacteriota bacterium]
MSAGRPIYLDHHATTPADPRVVEAMLPYFTEHFGNAASRQHALGWKASEAVEHARHQVARLLGARAKEIVFTSGATEANALAIRGVLGARRDKGAHVVTVASEHKSVLDLCQQLAGEGGRVTVVEIERDGRVDPARVAAAIGDDTVLVSVMTANNEIGVMHPLAEVSKVCRARGVWLHTDAVQAAGHVPFDVEALGIDLASVTAHKMYGPKGVGALYVRREPKVAINPQAVGGGQEQGLRAGTLNVPAIVGFGAAAAIARDGLASEGPRVAVLRDRLRDQLMRSLEGVTVNGSMSARLPHNLHLSFAGVDGEALMTSLADDVAVSSGSACASGSREPSHVMRALGVTGVQRWGALRFGLGRGTSSQDIDAAVARVVDSVMRLRAMSPVGMGGPA